MAGINKIVRASKRTPCPVCNGQDWPCYAFADGEVAGCKNYVSVRQDRDGLYLHILKTRDILTRGGGEGSRGGHADGVDL